MESGRNGEGRLSQGPWLRPVVWEKGGQRQQRTHWMWADDIGAQPLGVRAFLPGVSQGDLQIGEPKPQNQSR